MNWLFNIFSRGLLSGRWTGSYEQDGQTFPIETSIRHRGNKLQGTMLDLKRSHQQPLRKALEGAGLPFNEIQQFIQEVRSQFPDSIDGKIDYLSCLPEQSLIEGCTDGSRISFTKRYEGHQEIEYILGDLVMPQSVPCEIVEYSGTFNSDRISGIWFIKPSNKSDTEASGTFQLTRENT